MQIPVYQQQTSVGGGAPLPRAEATPVSPAIGQALSNVGQAMQNVGQGIAQEATVQQKLLREQEEQDAKAWAGNVASNAYLQWQQNLNERKAAATGPAQNFTPDFIGDFDKYASDTISTAPTPQSKLFLQQHLTSLRTQLGGQAISFEASARVADRVNNVSAAIDNWSNVVYSDPSKAGVALATIEQTMPEVGPEARDKLLKTAREKIPFFAASGSLERDAQSGNITGIQATRAALEGKDGESMDPGRRASLITKAYGYENGILAAQERQQKQAEAEAQARETAGTNAYNKAFDLASSGRYFSTDFISETSAAVAGTTAEKPFQELVKSQAMVAGFASMSLAQQQSELERMRAAGSDPMLGVNPTEQATQQQLEKINTAAQQAYKENPWKAAQGYGVIRDVPSAPITDANSALQLIAQRMPQIGVVENRAGRQISPLQPQEASDLLRVIESTPVDTRAQVLNQIGGILQSSGRIADLANQWHDQNPAVALAMKAGAGGANGNPLMTTSGTPVSAFILSGEQAIRDKTVKIDDTAGAGIRSQINTAINSVLPPAQEADAKESAYYIALGSAARNGRTAPNSTDIQNGINAATGGITNTGGTRFNGEPNRVAMPYGWTESQFTSSLKAAGVGNIENTVNGAPIGEVYIGRDAMPVADFMSKFPSYKLVRVGVRGTYAVQAGQQFVSDVMGRPVTVHLNLGQQPAQKAATPAATQVDNPFGG
ncbi:hypothetical protein PCA31118_04670 [Pandoraea captiosa]|uniref:Uncharacterized protein n=1 Tax=Pandoraea captiosa TaxID=2508302 RepID=A0A5E5AKR7_9BURK|nr:hypothetical protein [Pandoraea captiosa]VVE74054.1 hypothetical protein PCA31118_04670 [Pandoraea captiosa]